MIHFRGLLLIASLLVFASAQSSAQGTLDEERYGDWGWLCGQFNQQTEETCGLVQEVTLKDSGQSVLRAVFQRLGDADSLVLNLPLGFSLPQGVVIRIDQAEPERHAVRTCTQAGCLVAWQPAEEFVSLMKKGSVMSVGFLTLEGKPFTIPLSLKGFTSGYERVESD